MAGRHWNTRNLRTDTSPGLVPPGLIIMWSGAQLPDGWALCDGQNGTPDLRDRFIVGAGGSYAVDATGGVASHTHSHTVSGTTGGPSSSLTSGGGLFNEHAAGPSHGHGYSTTSSPAEIDNRPPYYALAFIQKLPYNAPADGVHYNEGNLGDATGLLPKGAILIWSGSVDSIPQGWALCNGQSGTPDLRDRFVVAAGGSYAIGATGGQAFAGHTHTINVNTGGPTQNVLYDTWNAAARAHPKHYHNISGALDSASPDNRPPYYALCYIMRVA